MQSNWNQLKIHNANIQIDPTRPNPIWPDFSKKSNWPDQIQSNLILFF
jgi:hypothetical protein